MLTKRQEDLVMITVCTVASEYLGLDEEDCIVSFDNEPRCSYYHQGEDDPDHPSVLPRVCGNCTHWVVLKGKGGDANGG